MKVGGQIEKIGGWRLTPQQAIQLLHFRQGGSAAASDLAGQGGNLNQPLTWSGECLAYLGQALGHRFGLGPMAQIIDPCHQHIGVGLIAAQAGQLGQHIHAGVTGHRRIDDPPIREGGHPGTGRSN